VDPITSAVSALQAYSAAWQTRDFAGLAERIDEAVVFVLPGFGGRLVGREALVQSYREFMDRATLTAYSEEPASASCWAGCEVVAATVPWSMSWLADGVANRARGHDVFLLRAAPSAPEGWRVIWRTMVFLEDT
jgi:Domain of unknown function (DUF4440)